MTTIYTAAGELEGLVRLATAWHTRVLADPVVSHAFSHGYHPDHTARLAAYWSEALGGPPSGLDESTIVRMHSGNGPHEDMNQRAIACFDQAMTDTGLTDNPLRQALHDYFAWSTNTSMNRYHTTANEVPDNLPIPHWSWNGLQTI
ncbi:group II truncated hemoglobin [Paractinoplanes lichenicola]|uniref:Group II truncated hemoglobin n=1 Tax=Paractinoplanes lichenicola TaxID=2802976 RepID=A0ABS1VYD3_9ACTN|nr:group II truncated hemoglobin [Actinoplanes lichenicola]MBL7259506.1 group II truncated hemoglobin [Actinoplanes lichenicola]